MKHLQDPSQVAAAFDAANPISRETLLQWLDANELSVRGAAFAYLERADCLARISPLLTQDQFDDRYLDYLKQCLLEDINDEWVHARYEAAWALASWFRSAIARDEKHPRLIALRKWLGQAYKRESRSEGHVGEWIP